MNLPDYGAGHLAGDGCLRTTAATPRGVEGQNQHLENAGRLNVATSDYGLAFPGGRVRISYNPHASSSLEGAKAIKKP